MDLEAEQVQVTLAEVYGGDESLALPSFTVIVVNKRINQRFFETIEKAGKQEANPPSGTIIDSALVEGSDSAAAFDFYLIPL